MVVQQEPPHLSPQTELCLQTHITCKCSLYLSLISLFLIIIIIIHFYFINCLCNAMFCVSILVISVEKCWCCLWEGVFYMGLKFGRVSPASGSFLYVLKGCCSNNNSTVPLIRCKCHPVVLPYTTVLSPYTFQMVGVSPVTLPYSSVSLPYTFRKPPLHFCKPPLDFCIPPLHYFLAIKKQRNRGYIDWYRF
jgi:hypothetical protein